MYMLVYIDDIVFTGSDNASVDDLIHSLSKTFPVKNLGRLSYVLGLEVTYNSGGANLDTTEICLGSSTLGKYGEL